MLTAAKLIGEVAGVERFATDAKLARTAGSAPIPASSGRTDRHRLDRGGNRQLNCALHRLAVSKARLDPETAVYLARKQAEGKSRREALRCLMRHLARRVFKLLQPNAPTPPTPLGDRPPATSKRGVLLHCNTPPGTPVLWPVTGGGRSGGAMGSAGAAHPLSSGDARVGGALASFERAGCPQQVP